MANYTGADVIIAGDITKYQPDAFAFGIAATDTEAVNFLHKLLTIYSDN
jgi:curli biogenesis system outer membrane secretion channel CsgG